MSKLYIFGIGGTGSRVLKSLTMLLASGVKMNVTEIVPIIIDPDHAAADLTRTVELMRDYRSIYKELNFTTDTQNCFFSVPINLTIHPEITIPLHGTQDKTFAEYIGLEQMTDSNGNFNANYALAKMLFSDRNLASSMDVGFKGNPNIGSVVLNQFANSIEFNNIAASFKQDDRIFVISSIFGGTGASGFPLLLKNIKAISSNVPGNAVVKSAPVGAITVLPYFDVQPDYEEDERKRSEIDSSTFISKTKAALSYYDRNMNEVNALYYIGDTIYKQYKNSEGGTSQRNDAHFVELAAALAVINFAAIDKNDLKVDENGMPTAPIYREFGIKDIKDNQKIIMTNLDDSTSDQIKKPLTKFVLFCKYLNEQMGKSVNVQWRKARKFDSNFLSSSFYKSKLTAFRDSYIEWLKEMSQNNRGFEPFDLTEKRKNVFSLVRGEDPKKIWGEIASNYDLFDKYLNQMEKKLPKDISKNALFIELFHLATEKLVEKKFNM